MERQRDGLEPLSQAWELQQQDEAPVVAAVPVSVPVSVPEAVVARLAAAVGLAQLGREEAGQQVPAVAAGERIEVQQWVLSS